MTMQTGEITQYVDVAQIVLYLFWIFFSGLIYYLLRENHREGYPMDNGRENGPKMDGWPPAPAPKTYKMANGHEFQSPNPKRVEAQFSGKPSHPWNGATLEPIGDPLLAGVGPGAWTNRIDEPEMTHHGEVKIVPLRVAKDHGVSVHDTDSRGHPVYGDDNQVAGTVRDFWVDRAEMMFRYIEMTVTSSGKNVLIPINFARIHEDAIEVHALLSHQFNNVPATKSADQVTSLEEEKIMAYFGAGLLYAEPNRQEPIA
jgi:photosynthetic reaction center H subunit